MNLFSKGQPYIKATRITSYEPSKKKQEKQDKSIETCLNCPFNDCLDTKCPLLPSVNGYKNKGGLNEI